MPRTMSDDQARALQLLRAGAIGGHLGAVGSSVCFLAARGLQSAVSCLIAAVVALAFYMIGQAVQVMMADERPQKVLTAALISYGARVSALGGLLALALSRPELFPAMDPVAVVVGTLTVVVTWLAAEIVAFSRMRFPDFDAPSRTREPRDAA